MIKQFIMKNLSLAIFFWVALTGAAQDVEIKETNFPDENFRNYLLKQSYAKDGVIKEKFLEPRLEVI